MSSRLLKGKIKSLRKKEEKKAVKKSPIRFICEFIIFIYRYLGFRKKRMIFGFVIRVM